MAQHSFRPTQDKHSDAIYQHIPYCPAVLRGRPRLRSPIYGPQTPAPRVVLCAPFFTVCSGCIEIAASLFVLYSITAELHPRLSLVRSGGTFSERRARSARLTFRGFIAISKCMYPSSGVCLSHLCAPYIDSKPFNVRWTQMTRRRFLLAAICLRVYGSETLGHVRKGH